MQDARNSRGGGEYPPKPERPGITELTEKAVLYTTLKLLRGIRPGDIDAVREAQEEFAKIAKQGPRGFLRLLVS
jgi:hypothetical protein